MNATWLPNWGHLAYLARNTRRQGKKTLDRPLIAALHPKTMVHGDKTIKHTYVVMEPSKGENHIII
jgi:hypothetical protein